MRLSRFNPLHCGAVVASKGSRHRTHHGFDCLNPLHCGAVVASQERAKREIAARQVSIPFIAGQWSLPIRVRMVKDVVVRSQSPSLRGSGRFRRGAGQAIGPSPVSIPFIAGQWSLRKAIPSLDPERGLRLNPLHCGAVVASGGPRPASKEVVQVSIPFIAGQWSLRYEASRMPRT